MVELLGHVMFLSQESSGPDFVLNLLIKKEKNLLV